MLPQCNFKTSQDDRKPKEADQTTTMGAPPQPNKTAKPSSGKPTFDFDLASIPIESQNPLPTTHQLPINPVNANLSIDLPTLVVHSPKTPTLSRKLKAMSLDSDSNASAGATIPSDPPLEIAFSMPNTPKRQFKSQQKMKGLEASHFGSNQSISSSQTLKTLPEVMTLSDFSNGKKEPVRIRAKGLLERRGSNVSLTIDLCAAESQNYRLNTVRSVSNLNLTNIGSRDCTCKSSKSLKTDDVSCECMPKLKNCKKCNIIQKNSQKLVKKSTESCLCDETSNNINCQGYKMCQYSRLGCLNYLSYMRRKSLSNENLYIGPSYEYKKIRKSEYPRNPISQFKNQILSEDFQLHLQNIQYLQTAGNVLSKKQLKESCKIEHLKDLHKEFWELPQNFQEKNFISGSQHKNRYKTILPNEHSRVVLDLGNAKDSSGAEGYINANYIKGYDYTETAYIATQGPLIHTTEDLWQMAIQSNAQKIVMLTPVHEKGRTKCEIYFPEHNHTKITCGKYEIKCLHVHEENYYKIRTLRIRDTSTSSSAPCTTPQQKQLTPQQKNFIKNINSPKYCCDKMKECGIECKNLSKPIDNVAILNESNQNSPKSPSPLITKNNNRFFNSNEDEDDDIFTNIEYKSCNRPSVKIRDCKFSDDFTDILCDIEDDILETDKLIQHYWYQTWPDHNLANTEQILGLALDVLDNRQDVEHLFNSNRTASHLNLIKSTCQKNLADNISKKVEGGARNRHKEKITVPIIVHCSAGIGRTGCFLAILNGIQQLKHNSNVDVLAIVCALRLNRGGMVQTAEQYELIHKVLALYGDYIDK